MEKRNIALTPELRADEEGNTTAIVGYAAVFYDESREAETEYELWPGTIERIRAGAFDANLSDDVRALFDHRSDLVLGRNGKTMRLSVDSRGLKYEIDAADHDVFKRVATMLERGDIDGSSFAFRSPDVEWKIEERGSLTVHVREIKSFGKLLDVGPVTYPAYTGTSAGNRAEEAFAEARSEFDAQFKAIGREDRARRRRLLDMIDAGVNIAANTSGSAS